MVEYELLVVSISWYKLLANHLFGKEVLLPLSLTIQQIWYNPWRALLEFWEFSFCFLAQCCHLIISALISLGNLNYRNMQEAQENMVKIWIWMKTSNEIHYNIGRQQRKRWVLNEQVENYQWSFGFPWRFKILSLAI